MTPLPAGPVPNPNSDGLPCPSPAAFAELLRHANSRLASGDAAGARTGIDQALGALRTLRGAAAAEGMNEAQARLMGLCDYFTGELRGLSRSLSRERLASVAAVAAMLRGAPRL